VGRPFQGRPFLVRTVRPQADRAIRGVGSCKLKLGVEKRDADNVASVMALGPRIGPLAAVVGVAF